MKMKKTACKVPTVALIYETDMIKRGSTPGIQNYGSECIMSCDKLFSYFTGLCYMSIIYQWCEEEDITSLLPNIY